MMNYFTRAWWCGQHSGDPYPLYDAYIERIRDELDEELLELHDDLALQNATLQAINLTPGGELSLSFLQSPEEEGGEEEDIQIHYSGDLCFESDPGDGREPRDGVLSHGFGRLVYDEIDALEDGEQVHRILLSSGIILKMTFRKVEVTTNLP